MNRSGFKPKQQLTPAQLQVKAEYALAKQRQRENNSLAQPKRRNKYNNKPVWYDGIYFKSTLQCEHYKEYRLLEKVGEISEYDYEVDIPLHFNGILIGHYRVDHKYYDIRHQCHVLAETKSEATEKDPLWRWKWKHTIAEYPQYIFELRVDDKLQRTYPKKDLVIDDYQRGAA